VAVNFMAANSSFRNIVVEDGGRIVSDNGAFSTDGFGNLAVLGNLFGLTFQLKADVTPQALSSTNTITIPAGISVVLLSAAAAVTGIIMPVPSVTNDTFVVLINTSAAANTITFNATSSTSHVADASDVITGLTAAMFVWDVTQTLWYRIKAS
jgi:hypothetical protein